VAIAIASLAAVVWLVVALVVITDHGGDGGTAETLPPVTSTSSTVPGASTPATTVAPSAGGGTTVAPTTGVSTTSTTVPPSFTIDLAVPASAMTPAVLANFPIVDSGSSHPSYVVTTDHHKRIVVLDMVSADVSFADLTTGAWTTFPSDVPVANWSGYFVLGPDDVIYMQMRDTGSGVAYALHDGRYVEVGRYPTSVGDQVVVAARAGPAVIGDPTHPLTPYLGTDGAPSGATLADNDFGAGSISATHLALSRGARTWSVDVAHSSCNATLCTALGLGPADDAVLSNVLGNGPSSRISWLSDKLRSWDTDWSFVGPVDSGLIVVHLDGDQFAIGLAK
jgi:hypothetical protein